MAAMKSAKTSFGGRLCYTDTSSRLVLNEANNTFNHAVGSKRCFSHSLKRGVTFRIGLPRSSSRASGAAFHLRRSNMICRRRQ